MLKAIGILCLVIIGLIGKQIAKSRPTPENRSNYIPPPPPEPYENDNVPLGT